MFGRKNGLKQAKERLLEEMATLDQKSPEYSRLNKELETITKSNQNENAWRSQFGVGLASTVIQAVCSTVNIWSVLKHEDRGNVVTTKSLNYVKKP